MGEGVVVAPRRNKVVYLTRIAVRLAGFPDTVSIEWHVTEDQLALYRGGVLSIAEDGAGSMIWELSAGIRRGITRPAEGWKVTGFVINPNPLNLDVEKWKAKLTEALCLY